MQKLKWILTFLAALFIAGTIFSCSVQDQEAEPVTENETQEESEDEKTDDAATEKEDGKATEQEKTEETGSHGTTFEHEVRKEINGEVREDQGEEWWKLDEEENNDNQ
ncbi:MAG: hypothetical protein R6U91_03940 [Bacillota bacterium]